jgi:hypothetical protein
MSLVFYKVVHIFGFALLLAALGGMVSEAAAGATSPRWRSLSALHGVALVLVLLSGFGMLAKLGGGFPGWVIAKLLIWLALGAAVVLVRRAARSSVALWLGLSVLAAAAGYLAIYKPF